MRGVLIATLCCALGCYEPPPPVAGPAWIRLEALAESIRPGMTAAEVRAILGEPNGGAADGSSIHYETPRGRLHQTPRVVVHFDGEYVDRVEACPFVQIPFDAFDWKNATPARRGCMKDDLLNRIAGRVRTRQEVHDLLGQPDEWRRGGEVAVYWLGSEWPPVEAPSEGFSDHLAIAFDKDAAVTWEVLNDWRLEEFAPRSERD